jgi:UDP-N-acetylglucosamine 1-carboxyvinyltransferase
MKGFNHAIIPDRIETGTFMIAAALTGGEIKIKNCIPDNVEALIVKLQSAGVDIIKKSHSLLVKGRHSVKPVNLITSPYPGFPTDMQAQFMVLMSLAKGVSSISETVFENRFMHVAELRRMGADISIDGHTAMVKGVKKLTGAPVMATDLRASASLILAGLAAKGKSTISRVYHLDRGYEKIEEKFSALGASIKRV